MTQDAIQTALPCGGDHRERLSPVEVEALNRGFNGILEALKDDDGALPGWSAVRVSGALHAMLMGAHFYHSDSCDECEAAMEVFEKAYLETAVEVEHEKDQAARRVVN